MCDAEWHLHFSALMVAVFRLRSWVLPKTSCDLPGAAFCLPFLPDLCLRTTLFSSSIGESTAFDAAGRRNWMRDMLVLRWRISVLGGRRRYPSAMLDCKLSMHWPSPGDSPGFSNVGVLGGEWDLSPVTTIGSSTHKLQSFALLNIMLYCYCDLKCITPCCPANTSACHIPQVNLAGLLYLLAWKQKMQSHLSFFILAVRIIPVMSKNLGMILSFSLCKMVPLIWQYLYRHVCTRGCWRTFPLFHHSCFTC